MQNQTKPDNHDIQITPRAIRNMIQRANKDEGARHIISVALCTLANTLGHDTEGELLEQHGTDFMRTISYYQHLGEED